MTADLRGLGGNPFELLVALESRLRASGLDVAAGRARIWVGLGFRVGDEAFVTPREEVREVLLLPAATRVPNARPWLLGVANVRGSLLTLIDLARLLHGQSRPPARSTRVLVLNAARMALGFVVDEVSGYRQFLPQDQAPELAAADPAWQAFLLGAFRQPDAICRVLSLHRLAQSEHLRETGA